jgi:hypothetical protein
VANGDHTIGCQSTKVIGFLLQDRHDDMRAAETERLVLVSGGEPSKPPRDIGKASLTVREDVVCIFDLQYRVGNGPLRLGNDDVFVNHHFAGPVPA